MTVTDVSVAAEAGTVTGRGLDGGIQQPHQDGKVLLKSWGHGEVLFFVFHFSSVIYSYILSLVIKLACK